MFPILTNTYGKLAHDRGGNAHCSITIWGTTGKTYAEETELVPYFIPCRKQTNKKDPLQMNHILRQNFPSLKIKYKRIYLSKIREYQDGKNWKLLKDSKVLKIYKK